MSESGDGNLARTSAQRWLSEESIALVDEMLRDGFSLHLNVRCRPEAENHVESGTAMFTRREWEDVLDEPNPDRDECDDASLRECLEAYSGYCGSNDPNDWIATAAEIAREKSSRRAALRATNGSAQ